MIRSGRGEWLLIVLTTQANQGCPIIYRKAILLSNGRPPVRGR